MKTVLFSLLLALALSACQQEQTNTQTQEEKNKQAAGMMPSQNSRAFFDNKPSKY